VGVLSVGAKVVLTTADSTVVVAGATLTGKVIDAVIETATLVVAVVITVERAACEGIIASCTFVSVIEAVTLGVLTPALLVEAFGNAACGAAVAEAFARGAGLEDNSASKLMVVAFVILISV
jgi:hypothetical protein